MEKGTVALIVGGLIAVAIVVAGVFYFAASAEYYTTSTVKEVLQNGAYRECTTTTRIGASTVAKVEVDVKAQASKSPKDIDLSKRPGTH